MQKGLAEKMEQCKEEIKKVIKGKDDIIHKILCAVLAGGHILLEDIPGVGKTTLAMSVSKTMSLDYKRMQFTPDVLPSDITGFSMYNSKTGDFEYKEGAVYSNLFLADEINRTSPKTQSALLEVMEEGRVTVDGITHDMPSPFMVIATQNPLGSAGTQRLPESQMDRFLICLSVGYPDHENAVQILKGNSYEALSALLPVMTKNEVITAQKESAEIYVSEEIYDYIINLTEATRNPDYFLLGLSPRGSIALLRSAKAAAWLDGRDYTIPEDIHYMFHVVCRHRLVPCTRKRAAGEDTAGVLDAILKEIPIPSGAGRR